MFGVGRRFVTETRPDEFIADDRMTKFLALERVRHSPALGLRGEGWRLLQTFQLQDSLRLLQRASLRLQ